MKRFYLVVVVLLACGAGFFGGQLRDALTPEPEPVHAQSVRAPDGIRIAILNLERAARQSKTFIQRKDDWDEAQKALKLQDAQMEREMNIKEAEIMANRAADPNGDLIHLRAEYQALEEARKFANEEHKRYLGALMAQYQKEVLLEIMEQLQKYVAKNVYDLVLQDYDDAAADADFFSGAAYAQSLMSKPVLLAPGKTNGVNKYATDITEAIIALVKNPVKNPD